MSIPKKIHYCWFGKQPYPEKVKKCISSWKVHLGDYELVRWDESNSPMELPFVKKAYKKELWAFVSDYVRLKVLYEQGGIYLDTDMYAAKSIDDLLDTDCFFGSESETIISCGIIGVTKEHPLIGETLKLYDNLIIPGHYELEKISIPQLITRTFALRYNYKGDFKNEVKFEDIIIYPQNYFYSFPNDMHANQDFKMYIDESTYMLHLWAKSWKEVSEFTLIKRKQYFKAFKKMMQMIIKHKITSISYYKRIYRFYKQSKNK
jgi:mannosyltransferase OCH1-like enzyme